MTGNDSGGNSSSGEGLVIHTVIATAGGKLAVIHEVIVAAGKGW